MEEKSSSSESSSLTASNSTAVTVTATAAKVASPRVMDTDMPNLKQYGNGIEWSTLLGQGSSDGGAFSEIGGFTAASMVETTPFGFGGTSVNQQSIADHLKFEDNTVQQQFGDPTAQVDPNMGFEPLDWGSGGGDQTLFDLTSSVDHAYWSQSQWASSDQDQNGLYLP